jgi:CubicO group peptidase (beta-lactamase class C family)
MDWYFMVGTWDWHIHFNRHIRFMWGHGGQFAFIVPEKSLVVVMTSIPNTQG